MIDEKKHTVKENIARLEKIPFIKAGDDRLTLGVLRLAPTVPCRVIAEEFFQDVLSDLREIKATEDEMKEIVRETIEWLKSVEGNDQMEANPDATILELEKLL